MDELEIADQEASKPTKVMRRLAQNREAARKSRLRKKAYIQQLESSRIKLAQLEQELQRARQQQQYGSSNPGTSIRHGGGSAGLGFAAATVGQMMDPGVAAFELDYGDWALRRLAQNREAARKSRLRKKAYIQQLESSRLKLAQLERELQRARQQQQYGSSNLGTSMRHGGGSAGLGFAAAGQMMDPGVAAFELDYGDWVHEQDRHTRELRAALEGTTSELELQMMVETGLNNYDKLFRIKGAAAQSDVFCVMSGLWRSPAERFFLWIGGFRPSEVLKILSPQLQPMTELQSGSVYNLQLSSAQAEDALTQGMEKLQQTLAESLMDTGDPFASPNAYMVGAVEKLKGLVGFVQQADHLRLETLQNMNRILNTRQAAKGLLVLGEYFQRLRALSTLWAAGPRESAIS